MSILPCDLDPIALRVVVGRFWDLAALREHVRACRACTSVQGRGERNETWKSGTVSRNSMHCKQVRSSLNEDALSVGTDVDAVGVTYRYFVRPLPPNSCRFCRHRRGIGVSPVAASRQISWR
jgi:hypothetical protein